jgi:thiol-disulfide isomerase/thioredoxin
MKKILLLNFALVLTLLVNAQTVVEQPKIGMSTASNVKIEKIVLSDSATVFWFHTKAAPGNWISIPKKTYLLPGGSKDTLFVKAAEGIPLNKQYIMPSSGEVSYKLTFPKIDASVSRIDYGEADGTWFIFDIRLKPDLYKSMIPEKLSGNWFRADNAQWEISLLDSAAVYKSRVWKILKYEEKNGTGTLRLKNASKNLTLYTKQGDDGNYMIGETPAKMLKYTNEPNETVIPEDNETFKLPVFKMDTAIYCGFIKNFNPRFRQRTGMVYVNDVLAGDQIPYTFNISDNGYFEVKITHINPQMIFVRLPFYNESIFIEPGKRIFQFIDNGSKTQRVLYMGDGARVNTDLNRVKDIYSFNYSEMRDKILDFTPEQYKLYCENSLIRDLNKLKEFSPEHRICGKANQLWSMHLNYRSAEQVLSYWMNFESAYRVKNKVPNTQREIPIKPAVADSSYYSFLTMEFVNDPFAVLTSDYSSFINRLKFLDILRPNNLSAYSLSEIAAALEKSGVKLTPQEKELSTKMAEFDLPEFKKIEKDFQEKYGKQMSDFIRKYNDKLKKANIQGEKLSDEELLMKQGIQLTDEEKALLSAIKERDSNPLIKKKNTIMTENREQISQFYSDHQDFTNEIYRERFRTDRNEKLGKLLGIHSGLAVDAMNAQDICQQLVREMIPLTDQKLKAKQRIIANPFIASYLKVKNDEVKSKIERNKLLAKDNKIKSVVKEVPKSEGDKVFEAIMNNYKGKVVFVDFWATWCGPCREGITRIKPLKEELANENVAFVYITNPSSPKATYDNMIPDIKGEHYRLTQDEWNVVSGKFSISGIPHYVLVGKEGQVINPHLMYMDILSLKNMLMKYVKE